MRFALRIEWGAVNTLRKPFKLQNERFTASGG